MELVLELFTPLIYFIKAILGTPSLPREEYSHLTAMGWFAWCEPQGVPGTWDNEWGFSNRMVELAGLVASKI